MSVDVVIPVLEKAITDLRHCVDSTPDGDVRIEVANDLALLHAHLMISPPAAHPRWDAYRRAHIRLVKAEEISDEVLRGEHREDD